MVKKILFFFVLLGLFTSCAPREKIAYFQNISDITGENLVKYQSKIQTDDLLMIIISAPNPEAAKNFNLPVVGVMGSNPNIGQDAVNSQMRFQTYLVDSDGNIELPVIGTFKIGGLSRQEAIEKLDAELKKYIDKPIINLRIMNFKISVMGEVVRPGTFDINTERITVPQALSMAGDMTIYGNRSKVLLIREQDGIKSHHYIDITKGDFINSQFYYLSQNDILYVEPNKTRINSSVIGPNVTIGISAISLLITIIALATR